MSLALLPGSNVRRLERNVEHHELIFSTLSVAFPDPKWSFGPAEGIKVLLHSSSWGSVLKRPLAGTL